MVNNNQYRKPMPVALQYAIAFACGVTLGCSLVPDPIIGVGYIIVSVLCIYHAFMGNVEKFFTYVPFLIYEELYARENIHYTLYLFAQYVMLASFALLLLKQGALLKFNSRSFVFILIFALIELIDAIRTNEPDFARLTIVNSFLLFAIAFWSATNTVPLKLMNTLINNLKLGGAYLTGIIAAGHIFGHVTYVNHSSSAATNGLAPVQISGYLGTAAIFFFLSIVNEHERKNIAANIVMFIMSTVFVILSFSRGGLYFIGAVVLLYMFFNWKKASNYSMLFLLIPVGIIIYNYVLSTTNGLIAERYAQEGASGRDVLVKIGFEIFEADPVAGIGTGNFSKEIVKRQLYSVESGAHNEFVRAAAEHGILGIITYWGFYLAMFIEVAMRRGTARAYSIYFLVLFSLIVVHNGMKISLQPLLLIFVLAVPVVPKIATQKNVQNYYKQTG